MGLSNVVFSKNPNTEFEIEGHKFVTRKLLTKDMLDMDEVEDDEKKVTVKDVVIDNVNILSKIIISIDGEVPDSQEETKEWLMNIENRVVIEILKKSQIYGSKLEEKLKNLDGTKP